MAKKLDFKDFLSVDYAPGMPGLIKKNAKKRKMDSGAGSNAEYSSRYSPEEDIDTIAEDDTQTEALNAQQRRNLSRKMKLRHKKIELGRKRALKRAADPARLKQRAEKAARNAMFKRLSKGKSKDDLSFQRRQEIEKRMEKMKKQISRMAVKLLPRVRSIDKERRTKK